MIDAPEPYPDIEAALIEHLAVLASTGEQTPPDFDGAFIRVHRIGGTDDGLTDRARVELACYAPTRREAHALAERVRQVVLACSGADVAGVYVDHVRTESQAGRTPYDNEDVRRIAAVYRFAVRRPRS